MKIDKLPLLIFGAVILIGAVVIIGQDVSGLVSGPGNDSGVDTTYNKAPDEPRPPTAGPALEIYNNSIVPLGKKPWDKQAFKDLKFLIEETYGAGRISKEERQNLMDNLYYAYTGTLKKGVEQFFYTSTKRGELLPLHRELKEIEQTDYAGLIATHRQATGRFYSLLNRERETSSYLAADDYDEDRVMELLNEVDDLSGKPYLNKSSIVRDIKKDTRNRLVNHMKTARIEQLRAPLQDYWSKKPYDAAVTQDFKNKLEQLANHSLLKNSREVKTFYKNQNEKLEGHLSLHETLPTKVKYGNKACAEICNPFSYYLEVCDSLRNQRDTINVSGTTN